ncbi:hypothetical protein KXR64_16550 [Brucella intermedia]|uniref:hypothetical protein n=1 Tax=Brucella TaxID=234 RepID=UPI0009466F95|nr:hypothetical protein [Brucella intermedia]
MSKRGKRERPVPDVTKLSNEELLDEFGLNYGWYDWTTSAAENRYHEEYDQKLRAELLSRMSTEVKD